MVLDNVISNTGHQDVAYGLPGDIPLSSVGEPEPEKNGGEKKPLVFKRAREVLLIFCEISELMTKGA